MRAQFTVDGRHDEDAYRTEFLESIPGFQQSVSRVSLNSRELLVVILDHLTHEETQHLEGMIRIAINRVDSN
jgi:hypothetical protein